MAGKDIPNKGKSMCKGLEAKERMEHWVKVVCIAARLREMVGTVGT